MRLVRRSSWPAAVCLIAATLLACFGLRAPRSYADAAKTATAQTDTSPAKYLGSVACSGCHGGQMSGFPKDFVLLTEYKTWSEQDKHSKAYSVLTEPRSKRMGD